MWAAVEVLKGAEGSRGCDMIGIPGAVCVEWCSRVSGSRVRAYSVGEKHDEYCRSPTRARDQDRSEKAIGCCTAE